jgi:5-methylcytosine-specific restriction endonuclease McrA
MILDVERSLIFMPLPRLQALPSGTDEFLYRIGWTLEEANERSRGLHKKVGAYKRGRPTSFDNRIMMQPQVVPTLARLQGIVRELVEARWVRKVRDLNGERLKERDLQKHLFGFDREQLGPVAGPLLDQNEGRCFYCGERAVKAHVDHFLPWARYPDNRLVNLVPAHDACNGAKSAYLASDEHLTHWLQRFTQPTIRRRLETIANELRWPLGNDETLAVSRVLYAQQPEGAHLWYAPGVFRQFDRATVGARIDAAIAARRVA